MELLLGTAKADITPEKPIPLAGFGGRTGPFTDIAGPISLRTAVFRQTGADGQPRNLLVAAADILWWSPERMDRLRGKLAKKGFAAADILLNASHSHSGPQTTKYMPTLGLVDEDYVDRLETLLLDAVDRSLADLEPVTVERGSGECRIGIHRRKRVDGRIIMSPNEAGPVDPEVTVVRFNRQGGKPKAVFVHYTCHPTTTNRNVLSPEYCGFAMNAIEAELGGEAVALFLQGCCGDVRPALIRDGKFYSGGLEEVRQLAGRLAGEALRVLNGPMQPLQPCRIGGSRIECALPFAEVPAREQLEDWAQNGENPVKQWAAEMLQFPERLVPSATLDMVKLDIADGLSLLAMNAEMVVAYGLFVKAETAGKTLPVAYSNGMIGYVSTAEQLDEGGYEATGSYYYFGLPSHYTKEAEPSIRRAMLQLLREDV